MTDVSIYVAAITAGAGIVGGAIPLVLTVIRDARTAERDRRERRGEVKRQALLDILGAAGELQTSLETAARYHGSEMGAMLATARSLAATVQRHAVNVALLEPQLLAGPAQQLADAAGRLVAAVTANTDLRAGELLRPPDFTELNERAASFRQIAVADAERQAKSQVSPPDRATGRRLGPGRPGSGQSRADDGAARDQ